MGDGSSPKILLGDFGSLVLHELQVAASTLDAETSSRVPRAPRSPEEPQKRPVPKDGYLARASKVSAEVEKEFISMNFTSDNTKSARAAQTARAHCVAKSCNMSQGAFVPKVSWEASHQESREKGSAFCPVIRCFFALRLPSIFSIKSIA